MSDFDSLSDPLFPIGSRSLRRATAAAEALGLVCVPYTYGVVATASQAGGSNLTLQLDTPSSQGPLVVTELVPPIGRSAASIKVRSGGAYLTDGTVRVGDALTLPRLYCGRLPSSPFCVAAGDTFAIVLDDPLGVPWAEGEGIRVNGIGVRQPVPGLRQLGPVNDELAAKWLMAVAADGVWWATTVQGTGTRYASVTGDVVVEAIVLAERNTIPPVEGTIGVHADDVQVRIGDHMVTPQGGPLNAELLFDGDRVVLLPGLRMPVPSETRLQILVHYPSNVGGPGITDIPIPVRATLLGRRGGVAGGCW